jgi:hypothetical protein
MPWYVGIDEAGYGPNLGPFVMAMSCVQAPHGEGTLWERFPQLVRQASQRKGAGLLIDDSKKVHTGKLGNANLELGVLGTCDFLPSPLAGEGLGMRGNDLSSFLKSIALGDSEADLAIESWYQPEMPLPHFTDLSTISNFSKDVDLKFGLAKACIIPAPRFNQWVDQFGVKSAASGKCVIRLLQALVYLPGEDRIQLTLDKQGGRNFYAPLLQEAFPESWIHTRVEGSLESVYEIELANRTLEVRVQPRADGEHLPVAHASMIAKYLRELFMVQFNAFWAKHILGLTPTAGYPVDAKRYYDTIEPKFNELGLQKDLVWRKK